MIWYCDSSALVKRYVRETGSRWFRAQVSQHQAVRYCCIALAGRLCVLYFAGRAEAVRAKAIGGVSRLRTRGQSDAHIEERECDC